MQTADEDELQQAIDQARRRQRTPCAPVPIADVVNKLLARRGYAQLQQGQQWEAVWQEAVGPALARNSRPGRMNRGVLEIVVENSAAMQELTFRKSQLLAAMRAATEKQAIRDLRFRIGSID